MSVGFYIPCFNAQQYIEKVLDSVMSQSVRPQQILLIDDGSTDKTLEIAERYPVQIVRHNTNQGLAAVRNTALKNLDTEYIACIDSDCLADENWLGLLLEKFNTSKVAGAGGSLIESCENAAQDRWRKVHMPQTWGNKSQEPEFLFGSNTVFKKQALLDVGGYDVTFRTNYEDVDICRRIRQKGYKIIYEPKAIVHHLKKDDLCSLLSSFWKWRSPYYTEQKFYDSIERFKDKIKDNIGLANRFLHEDLDQDRKDLLYIDFLLAFDHCIRDYMRFAHSRGEECSDLSMAGQWLSLMDLNFFYRFDRGNRNLNTLLPMENAVLQNAFAIVLILGKIIEGGFKDQEVPLYLYKDIIICISGYFDKKISDQLQRMILRNNTWSDFLEKKQNNLDRDFLSVFNKEFNVWFNSLKHEDKVLGSISDSAHRLYTRSTQERSFTNG